MKTRARYVLLVSALIISACAPAAQVTVTMTNPKSGARAGCSFPPSETETTWGGLTAQQAVELRSWLLEFKQSHNSPPTAFETCIKKYEILGFVRDILLPGTNAVYSSPSYRWSISYPGDWVLDRKDPGFIKIKDPASSALVGIHSVSRLSGVNLEDFANDVLTDMDHFLRQRGQEMVITFRGSIVLPNNIPGKEILFDIRSGGISGGKSRVVIAVIDRRGFGIDAETYKHMWPVFEPVFDQIIRSFTIEP